MNGLAELILVFEPDNPREAKLTHLLLSVRNIEEARLVLQHAIGILDVKEPRRGALGAADPEMLQHIGNLNGRSMPSIDGTTESCRQVPFSFSAGELSDWIGGDFPITEHSLTTFYGSQILETYQFVKIGLARLIDIPGWGVKWKALFESLPSSTTPVAVAYFDYRECDSFPPEQVMEFAAAQPRCQTILFDTFRKTGNLFDYCSQGELARWVQNARSFGLTAVVAGSVTQSCLSDVLTVAPDYIGVRGGVCRGRRTDQVDGRLVEQFLDVILEGRTGASTAY